MIDPTKWDIWSLGIVLLSILIRFNQAYFSHCARSGHPDAQYWIDSFIDGVFAGQPNLQELLKNMLKVNTDERWTADLVQRSAWMKEQLN
jgi:hypothetical protein